MLDEEEWSKVEAALHPRSAAAGAAALRQRLDEVSKLYERLTGQRGVHANVVVHHRAAHYGPPCRSCGRPLRTPSAHSAHPAERIGAISACREIAQCVRLADHVRQHGMDRSGASLA